MDKVFAKRSTRLLDHFSKFIITSHLPLRRAHVDHRGLQHIVAQTKQCLLSSTIVKEDEASYVLLSIIMFFYTEYDDLCKHDFIR
jgi:hypothetical protein